MTPDDNTVSRRRVLKATGGAVSFLGVGSARADDGPHERCPEATLKPDMVHYDDSIEAVCEDDHPETKELQADVEEALDERYPTVGALMDEGFVPYFDFYVAEGRGAWSHWINPEFVGDDGVLDPERPESVLVDHRWWRPIGVMFVATRRGDRVDPPPTVYEDEGEACTPWHAHTGIPGRYAWWKYRKLYETDPDVRTASFPCRTPWMLHVWTHPHPESVYAHDAPPLGNRGGPPAEDAGFETEAEPGEDPLEPDVLPDAFAAKLEGDFGNPGGHSG